MYRINREEYMNFLVRHKDAELIKVVSGIRRSGKSTLLELYKEYLIENGVDDDQIIWINFEDIDFEHLHNYRNLYDYIKAQLNTQKTNYIFLDEIQHVKDFEKAVDSLFIKKNVDIYITGSNAYFMSGELATLLTGRYVELKILPLSFKEYCEGLHFMYPDSRNLSKAEKYQEYLQYSSFPYALRVRGQIDTLTDYLRGLYNTLLLNDVVSRLNVSNVMMLESIVRFVYDNIGNELSIKKIADTMESDGRKIDRKTVEKYIQGLMDALMIYQAKRYNIKGKQYLSTHEKYYIADIGMRNMLLGSKGADYGHVLENIVYLELLRRGNAVFVGHLQNGEIDFVVQNSRGTEYYQVAASVLDENTLRRELASLESIPDSHPKYLLTLDEIGNGSNHNGIMQLNVLDWLLGD